MASSPGPGAACGTERSEYRTDEDAGRILIVRARAVRMVQEHRGEYPSLWAAVESITPKIGCVPQTLLDWVKRAEVDTGGARGRHERRSTADEGTRARGQGTALGQRDLEAGQRAFCPDGARPPAGVLKEFIGKHHDTFGVEPISRYCRSPRRTICGTRRCCARAADATRVAGLALRRLRARCTGASAVRQAARARRQLGLPLGSRFAIGQHPVGANTSRIVTTRIQSLSTGKPELPSSTIGAKS